MKLEVREWSLILTSKPPGGTHIGKGYGDVPRSWPLFSDQSPLPSLPIYRQCALLCPLFSIFRKFLHFQPCFGQNSSSLDPNFSKFSFLRPLFFKENPRRSLYLTFWNPRGTHPPNKKLSAPPPWVKTMLARNYFHGQNQCVQAGGRVPGVEVPPTSDREIFADLPGKERQGKKESGAEFFLSFSFSSSFFLGSTKMVIFYWEKAFHTKNKTNTKTNKKKSGKMALPPVKNILATPLVKTQHSSPTTERVLYPGCC